jgi:hypothetical protein
MRVRLEDLPPKVRGQIQAKVDTHDRRPTRSRAGISDRVPCPGHCHNCGQAFPTAHAWQLHADAAHDGNARWDIDLPNQTTPTATTT